jgi:hypothetical protein
MTELSPSTQDILDAYGDAPSLQRSYTADQLERVCIAAVLRRAARLARAARPARVSTEWGEGWLEGVEDVACGLERIAAELEDGANV